MYIGDLTILFIAEPHRSVGESERSSERLLHGCSCVWIIIISATECRGVIL